LNIKPISIFLKTNHSNKADTKSCPILSSLLSLKNLYTVLFYTTSMHILFLSHIWPPAIDGGSQIVYQSQKHLKKLGHSTLVLTTNCNSTDDFIIPKSKILNLKSSQVIRLSVYKTKLFVYLNKLILFLHLKSNILNLIRIGPVFKLLPFLKALNQIIKLKPEIIIAGPFPTTISLYANILTKILKTKLVILPCFHPQDPAFQNKILLNILKQADLIWALSSYEQAYLINKLAINSDKFFMSPPGISLIPLKIIPKKSNTINILFLGNFAAHKRIELLIKAFTCINQKFPNTSLTIAGQKTLYYPQLKKQIDKLNSTVKLKISIQSQKYGSIQLKKYLDQSHLLVNPSIHESFGIVFMEALSRGVPIIGSNIPNVSDLINSSQAGLVFEKNNSKDLVEKIETLITNQNLYKQFSQNGLKFSQTFNWPNIIKKFNEKIAYI